MKSLRVFLEMIKFEHTVFALPFAYLGLFLAAKGWPALAQFFWVTVAMAAARTAAMSFNRFIDRALDARNPRTANRPIQAGRIGAAAVAIAAVISLFVLGFAARQLNALVFMLWP